MAYLVRQFGSTGNSGPLSQGEATRVLAHRTGRDRGDVTTVLRGLRSKQWVTLYPPLKNPPEGAVRAQVRKS